MLIPVFSVPARAEGDTFTTMTSMTKKDMRTVTGRKGITFDTITVDGTLEEEIEAITNDMGGGLYLGPTEIDDTIIGGGSIYESANATIGGEDRDSAVVGEMGPIRASFLTELKFGFGPASLTSAGGLGVGGVSIDSPRVEIDQQR